MNEQDVIDYLNQHPDFFIDKEELLDTFSLPHEDNEEATSFLQHQLNRSRQQYQALKNQLESMLTTHSINVSLLAKIHTLMIALLKCQTISERITCLQEKTTGLLDVDCCQVWLRKNDTKLLDWDSAPLNVFDNTMPSTSEIDENSSMILLGSPQYRSACIVPLGKNGQHGGILFADTDSSRFTSDQNALLLTQLGQFATVALGYH